MVRLSYIILIVVFGFSSCKKKKDEVVFTGKITEVYTGSNVGSVNIDVSERRIQNNALNPNFISIGSSTSYSDGSYSLTVPRGKVYEYKLSISRSGYHDEDMIISSDDVKFNEDNEVNFKMYTKTWLKFTIENNFEPNETDNLTLYKRNIKPDCDACCDDQAQDFPGVTDTIFYCSTVGNRYFKYEYFVTNNSGSQYHVDSIYCPPGDTLDIFISY